MIELCNFTPCITRITAQMSYQEFIQSVKAKTAPATRKKISVLILLTPTI